MSGVLKYILLVSYSPLAQWDFARVIDLHFNEDYECGIGIYLFSFSNRSNDKSIQLRTNRPPPLYFKPKRAIFLSMYAKHVNFDVHVLVGNIKVKFGAKRAILGDFP